MTFAMNQRVITTVDVDSLWEGGQDVPAGSLGTITGLPVHPTGTMYGVLIDADPDKLPMSYDAHELRPA